MGKLNTKTTQTGFRATQKPKFMHDYHCYTIIRKDYVNRKGLSPLALRAVINGIARVMRVGVYVRHDQFDADAGRVKLSGAERERENDLNLIIANAEAKANRIFTTYRLKEKTLQPDEFKKLYLTADLRTNFILYARKISEGQEGTLNAATIRHQDLALNYLEEFKSPFMMYDLNYETIRKFDEFLRKKISDKTHGKFGDNHVWKLHSKIRKFIRIAKDEGLDVENPYEKLKPKKKPGQREYLLRDEVEKLINIWLGGELPFTHQQCLSAYLFSCCCGGFRISDLNLFDQNNIVDDKISFAPYKTLKYKNKIITLELPDIGKELIKNGKGKLFKLPTPQKFNLYMKSIAFIAGIKKQVTAHTARHTFATQYLEAGGNVVNLQQILGHSSIMDTMIYVHIIDKTVSRSMSIMNVFKASGTTEAHPQTY